MSNTKDSVFYKGTSIIYTYDELCELANLNNCSVEQVKEKILEEIKTILRRIPENARSDDFGVNNSNPITPHNFDVTKIIMKKASCKYAT